MFPIGVPGWGWSWGSIAVVGFIILLGIFLVPWFFFLLNLHNTLSRVSERNRAMPTGHVWLNFIPVFNLGWFIYTVARVRDSLRAEYWTRGWPADGDFGYNVGLAAGVLSIVSFFLGWIPVLGWGLAIADLVCWIIYWLKIADFKNRLGQEGMWRPPGPAPYGYSGPAAPPGAPGPPASPPAPGPPASPAAPGPALYQWPSRQAGPSPMAPGPPAPLGTAGSESARLDEGSPGATPAESDSSTEPGATRDQCAGCGTRFDPSDRFCRTCGLPLPTRQG